MQTATMEGGRVVWTFTGGDRSLSDMASVNTITHLLHQARDGGLKVHDRLYPLVYDHLRTLAHYRLRRFRPGDTLNTTALVHEAYLKLADASGDLTYTDRAHFFAVASRAMRFILIDYARARTAQKRGGRRDDLPLDALQIEADARARDLLDLNAALERLETMDERLSRVVEYKFFGGLTHEEIAEVTGWSVPTVKRDWRRARAWLYRARTASDDPSDD